MALEEIVAHKRIEVAARKAATPRFEVGPSDRDFAAALRAERTGFICECKKASPSQGLIRPNFDPAAIARSYAPFADAISVLTDQRFFQGSFEYLRTVRANADVPVLCKDFVVDPYQLYEARHHGADAILLMCSVLDQSELLACMAVARDIGIGTLVEVHDEPELERAIDAGAEVIGINNRNLQTLKVDLATTAQLAELVPDDRVRICESGIRDHRDVRRFRGEVDAFLIGTSLMKRRELDIALREMIFGRVKICGLTSPEAARTAYACGATHGGVMMWPPSKRYVSDPRAIVEAAPLQWVAVHVNAPIDEVAAAPEQLQLAAVQLHGDEDDDYIAALRADVRCEIWKAQRIASGDAIADTTADRALLDAYKPGERGGTGERFNWSLLATHCGRHDVVLSGGITPDNADEASALGCWALDLSSGVESAPGEKDPARVAALFDVLRG